MRNGRRATGKLRVDRVGQPVPRRGRLLCAKGQPIVDRTAVDKGARARIDHEHFGGPRHPQCRRDQLAAVEQHCQVDAELGRLGGHRRAIVVAVRIEQHELDAA